MNQSIEDAALTALAEKIASELFTEGGREKHKAKRLALVNDEAAAVKTCPGWCEEAVVTVIYRNLKGGAS